MTDDGKTQISCLKDDRGPPSDEVIRLLCRRERRSFVSPPQRQRGGDTDPAPHRPFGFNSERWIGIRSRIRMLGQ